MKKLIQYGVIIFLILAIDTAYAQFNLKNENIILPTKPIEQISIHTDRNLYLSGEKIWFTAHCINEDSINYHISKILYVEVFNHSKSAILKQKFKLYDGTAQGAITIPQEFLSGTYFIRAYTQLLRNYPPEHYFTSLLTIINPLKALPDINSSELHGQIDIIPENNKLINGLNTNVVIRIHDSFNKKIKSLSIIDDSDSLIAIPKLIKNQIGIFNITPQGKKTYFLKLIYDNNDSILKPLPSIIQNGIVIKRKTSTKDQITLNIIKKIGPSAEYSDDDYVLSVSSEFDHILFKTNLKLSQEITEFSIPQNIFSSGINHLTIRDKSGNIISTCPLSLSRTDGISFDLQLQKSRYEQRELVKLKIEAENINLDALSNLSISVVKKGTYDNFPLHIFDDAQLLKSYCQHIDLRSLNKDQINILGIYYDKFFLSGVDLEKLTNIKPVKYNWLPDLRDVSISGIAYNKLTKQPVSKIQIYLSLFKNNPQLHIQKTSRNGEFIFSLNNVEGFQDIILCPISQDEAELELKINSDFSNLYPETKHIPISLNYSNGMLLKEMLINHQTKLLYRTAQPIKQNSRFQYPLNMPQPQTSILLSDFIDLNSLETVFREIIPHCIVKKKNNQFKIQLGDVSNFFISENPLILIDNIPVFNVNELFKIHPSKIEKIEVNPTKLVLGDYIINGLITLTTGTENFGGIEIPKNSIFIEYQSITPKYKFIAPNYSTEESKLDKSADFRTLLYWNPDINLGNEKLISFYTSDHESEYEVIVRGFSDNGKFYFERTSFEVVK